MLWFAVSRKGGSVKTHQKLLQCDAVRCSVSQCDAAGEPSRHTRNCCSVLHVAVYCSVLLRVSCQNSRQTAAVCCSVSQHNATHCHTLQNEARKKNRNMQKQNAKHSDTLQHTATHCDTLYNTATYYNTLPHTATHCHTLQRTATHRNTPQHTATHCNTPQHTCIISSGMGSSSAITCETLKSEPHSHSTLRVATISRQPAMTSLICKKTLNFCGSLQKRHRN